MLSNHRNERGSVVASRITALLTVIAAAWIVAVSTSVPSAQATTSGRTVWDGVYTEQQAVRGKEQYAKSCSMCHVADLRGDGMAPALIGDQFMLNWSDLSANDLFVRTRTSMPQDDPRSLTDDAYVDLLSYVFQSNKFPAGEQELKPDADVLKLIQITKAKK